MQEEHLPTRDEIIFAMSGEQILGMGEEAVVYKCPTKPDYTIRVSRDAPEYEKLAQKIFDEKYILLPDIFEGRNYAQAVAYWPGDDGFAVVTINKYTPGISMEIHKGNKNKPSSEVALMKTMSWTTAIAELPDQAIDNLFDDLHFLSSVEYSIDVCNGGLFTNTGNILYDGKNQQLRIIDIQPFIREHPGINMKHTKGLNVPLNLCRGLLPGMYDYADEHAKYPPLIEYRTDIVNRVIKAAKRNNLSDLGGYSGKDMKSVAKYWEVQLRKLMIPEKYQDSFIKEICSVEDKIRYPLKKVAPQMRVSGRAYS